MAGQIVLDQGGQFRLIFHNGNAFGHLVGGPVRPLYRPGWPSLRLPPREYLDLVSFQPVADNLRESFRIVAASRPGGDVRELAGVSVACAAATFQMFNAAFLSGRVAGEAELTSDILLPMIHFQSRNLEWAYWL